MRRSDLLAVSAEEGLHVASDDGAAVPRQRVARLPFEPEHAEHPQRQRIVGEVQKLMALEIAGELACLLAHVCAQERENVVAVEGAQIDEIRVIADVNLIAGVVVAPACDDIGVGRVCMHEAPERRRHVGSMTQFIEGVDHNDEAT